ncbi:SLC13 family permease [Intrasporangium sp.]|uniref:SLC13 family permease n=1 Tax=Intrasporangium sp. TaxID=1925024 RepID=UPI003221C0EC
MDAASVSLLILAAVIVLFIANRLPVWTVAVLSGFALWVTGLVDATGVVAGFGDPVVIFIAALFIVSEGIDSAGVTTWLGQWVIAHAGRTRSRLIVATGLIGAVLSATITLNGSVAALLPLVVMLAVRIGESPSQMLMPLTFIGGAGSLLMLPGSPVNIIVSDAAADAGEGQFAFFGFALVGIPVIAGTIAICVLLGPRLLPRTRPATTPADLGRHAATLYRQYSTSGSLHHLRIRPGSPLVGTELADLDVSSYPDLTLHGAQAPGSVGHLTRPLAANDVLVASGDRTEISRFALEHRLTVTPAGPPGAQSLLTRETGVAEVVVPPRSALLGTTVYPGMTRAGGLVILSVQRGGAHLTRPRTQIRPGDALLLHGTWDALEHLDEDRDVLIVDSPDLVRRQAVPWGGGATRSVVILALMVVALAGGLMPPHLAGLAAATLMVLTRVISTEQAFRSVSWEAIVLIAALIPLTEVIYSSGAAGRVADVLLDAVGDGSPYLLLLAMFLLTALLGQMISNTATTLIVTPIAVAAALATGISVLPILMTVAVAGCASLLTPISTPGNMMIMAPGGYRFGDYWKLGLPVMVWWLACAVLIIPVFWSFHP